MYPQAFQQRRSWKQLRNKSGRAVTASCTRQITKSVVLDAVQLSCDVIISCGGQSRGSKSGLFVACLVKDPNSLPYFYIQKLDLS